MFSGKLKFVAGAVGGESSLILHLAAAEAARAVSKCLVTLTVLPAGNFAAHAAISAEDSPVAALNSAMVLSGKVPSLTV